MGSYYWVYPFNKDEIDKQKLWEQSELEIEKFQPDSEYGAIVIALVLSGNGTKICLIDSTFEVFVTAKDIYYISLEDKLMKFVKDDEGDSGDDYDYGSDEEIDKVIMKVKIDK